MTVDILEYLNTLNNLKYHVDNTLLHLDHNPMKVMQTLQKSNISPEYGKVELIPPYSFVSLPFSCRPEDTEIYNI